MSDCVVLNRDLQSSEQMTREFCRGQCDTRYRGKQKHLWPFTVITHINRKVHVQCACVNVDDPRRRALRGVTSDGRYPFNRRVSARVQGRRGLVRRRLVARRSDMVSAVRPRPPAAFAPCNDRSLESRYDCYLTMASSDQLCCQAEHFMKFVFADQDWQRHFNDTPTRKNKMLSYHRHRAAGCL